MDGAELMRKVMAAFEQSDLRPLLDAIHDEVVWKSASDLHGVFRFAGEYKDREGVREVLSKISMDYTFHHLRPLEVLACEHTVWGLFEVEMSFDPKGRAVPLNMVKLEMAIRWHLKDGKITEHRTFFDTAALLLQQERFSPPDATKARGG